MATDKPVLPLIVQPGSISASLDEVLYAGYLLDASDVSIQSGDYIVFMISGRQVRASSSVLPHHDVEAATNIIYGPNGVSMISQGLPIDKRYEIRPSRGLRIGFRVHILPARIDGNDKGISITMRILPKNPPDVFSQKIPREIVLNSIPQNGLVTMAGVTSSGKSTAIAALLRYAYELKSDTIVTACGRKIGTYEAPIEYIYDGINSIAPKISQTEIGPDGLEKWCQAPITAMRRALQIILIGECRDTPTMNGCIEAALTGHATLTTLHAGSVGGTFRRMVGLGSDEESGGSVAVTEKILSSLRLMIVQTLAPKIGGGRTVLREWLPLTRTIQTKLFELPPTDIAKEMQKEVVARKTSMGHSALWAYRTGIIELSTAMGYSGLLREELLALELDESVFEPFSESDQFAKGVVDNAD